MKVNYNINKNDLLAFSKYYLYSNKRRKVSNTINIIILIFILVISILPQVLMYGLYSLELSDFLFLLFLIGIFTLSSLFSKKIILYFTKRAFNKGNYNANIGNVSFEIIDKYIYIKGEHSESKVNLDVIVKVCETEKYFFLYINDVSAYIIPKFKIEGDSQELFEFLRNKILII